VNAISEEIKYRLPKLIANMAIALVFFTTSFIVLWTLSGISTDTVFLLQIGSLLVAGIFMIRTMFDVLVIVDKATGLFLRHLGIKEDWSRQRVFKDTIFIVAILLIAAAIFPVFTSLANYGTLLQEITTYAAMGLIILFVYDIGRTFYRITEKKANSVADRISNSINEDEKTNGK
jgi:cation transport ATPase